MMVLGIVAIVGVLSMILLYMTNAQDFSLTAMYTLIIAAGFSLAFVIVDRYMKKSIKTVSTECFKQTWKANLKISILYKTEQLDNKVSKYRSMYKEIQDGLKDLVTRRDNTYHSGRKSELIEEGIINTEKIRDLIVVQGKCLNERINELKFLVASNEVIPYLVAFRDGTVSDYLMSCEKEEAQIQAHLQSKIQVLEELYLVPEYSTRRKEIKSYIEIFETMIDRQLVENLGRKVNSFDAIDAHNLNETSASLLDNVNYHIDILTLSNDSKTALDEEIDRIEAEYEVLRNT